MKGGKRAASGRADVQEEWVDALADTLVMLSHICRPHPFFRQDVLLFLAPLQLRLLFSVLVGALTSTACICIDLNDPFRGAFQITPSSEQLVVVRDQLKVCVYRSECVQRHDCSSALLLPRQTGGTV